MAVKDEEKKSTVGRKTKYKKEYDELAFNYCLLGATDVELAKFFDVSEKTIDNWKNDHDSFLRALKSGKEEADSRVANSLFNRACGYSAKDTKFATFEGVITDEREYIRHYPPDTTACIFWLKNRQRDKWREKQDDIGEDATETKPVKVIIEVADASRDKV